MRFAVSTEVLDINTRLSIADVIGIVKEAGDVTQINSSKMNKQVHSPLKCVVAGFDRVSYI